MGWGVGVGGDVALAVFGHHLLNSLHNVSYGQTTSALKKVP